MAELGRWLETLGLGAYAAPLATNGVEDIDALRLLSEGDLEALGVLLGHRRKIAHALAQANGAAATTPATALIAERTVALRPASDAPSAERERRHLTVLFCDLVGYTELAQRVDPEVLQGIVRRYADACAACITRYEGYVFQLLGDGVVAFFGYPMAHEAEAERALRAALDIVDTLAALEVPAACRLAVRIGIASGPVVVSAARQSAVGETMNLAARLQGVAEPGQIVVSAVVQRLSGGGFEYEPLGALALKGIGRPTEAYRVVGASQVASRFDAATRKGLTSLVGREQELGLLLERWAQAQEGEGQVVLLSGEPGIGKSRILRALRQRLEGQGARAMRFQCSPYYVNSAYWPSIANLERTLRFARDEPAEQRLDKLEALITGTYGRPLADVRFVAAMLSIPCDTRYGALPMTPQRHKGETLRTLVDMTEAAAHRAPRVMLYEDLHWADPTTLEVLELMVDRVRTIPLLIVLTHRPEFAPTWGRHGHVSALEISKLTRAQASALVDEVTGGNALPAELHERILAKTDGVPLYIEELTRAILESGELRLDGERFDYADSDRTVAIPATLRDSLMARLDRYAAVKEIAQIGAAIGREFSHEMIRLVAPHGEADLERALAQLTESGLAFRRGYPPEAHYTFKHALMQEAAYESLLRSSRQQLHAKIAQVLAERFPALRETEPELLAHHLSAAGQNEPALRYWQQAGMRALQRLAHKEAVSHLGRGMALIATLPHSAKRDAIELDLRTPLGTASLALRGWQAPEVWSSLHPALALARSLGRPDALVPIYWGLWVYVLTQGRMDEALDWVNEMLAEAVRLDNADLELMGHRAACVTHFYRGAFAAAVEHGEQVLAVYDEVRHYHLANQVNTDPRTAVGIFMAPALWMLGRPDSALALIEANDAHARRRNHPFDLGYALTWGGEVFDLLGEPEPLLERVAEAERLGRSHNLPFISEVLAQLMKGLAWLRAGRLEEGQAQLQTAMGRWSGNGALARMPYFRAQIADALAAGGDCDAALRLLEQSLEQIVRPGWGERAHHAEVLRIQGLVFERQGRIEAAEQSLLAALDVARAQGALAWQLRGATSLAALWRTQGRCDEALALLQPVFDAFDEGRHTRDLCAAETLLAALRRDVGSPTFGS